MASSSLFCSADEDAEEDEEDDDDEAAAAAAAAAAAEDDDDEEEADAAASFCALSAASFRMFSCTTSRSGTSTLGSFEGFTPVARPTATAGAEALEAIFGI